MDVNTTPTFETWMLLERLWREAQISGIYPQTELARTGIEIGAHWETEDIDDEVLEWLYRGYVSTLPPRREAQIIWADWKHQHDNHLARLRSLYRHPDDRPGYVYLLRMGCYFKIGRTIDPLLRFPQISVKMPQETRLWAVFWEPDMIETEALMHKFYHQYHTNGEWFELPFEEAIYIRRCQGTTWHVYHRATLIMPREEWGEIDFSITAMINKDGKVSRVIIPHAPDGWAYKE